jgi:hypothetical protein
MSEHLDWFDQLDVDSLVHHPGQGVPASTYGDLTITWDEVMSRAFPISHIPGGTLRDTDPADSGDEPRPQA